MNLSAGRRLDFELLDLFCHLKGMGYNLSFCCCCCINKCYLCSLVPASWERRICAAMTHTAELILENTAPKS